MIKAKDKQSLLALLEVLGEVDPDRGYVGNDVCSLQNAVHGLDWTGCDLFGGISAVDGYGGRTAGADDHQVIASGLTRLGRLCRHHVRRLMKTPDEKWVQLAQDDELYIADACSGLERIDSLARPVFRGFRSEAELRGLDEPYLKAIGGWRRA